MGSVITSLKNTSLTEKILLGMLSIVSFGMVVSPFTASQAPTSESKINTSPSIEQVKAAEKVFESVAEEQPIVFSKKTVETNSLNKGTSQISTTGVNGIKKITYKVTKIDGVVVAKEVMSEVVLTPPVDEITSVGTYTAPATVQQPSNCDPNYSPCVPNVSYDLDCPDIGFMVRVIGTDHHRFDANHDGYGCESYN